MKTCTKCRRRLSDMKFYPRVVTMTYPDVDGDFSTESHNISRSVCAECDARRTRASRGTQTVHDVAQDILVDLRGRRR